MLAGTVGDGDRVYFLMRGWVGMGMTFAGMVGDGDKYLSRAALYLVPQYLGRLVRALEQRSQ